MATDRVYLDKGGNIVKHSDLTEVKFDVTEIVKQANAEKNAHNKKRQAIIEALQQSLDWQTIQQLIKISGETILWLDTLCDDKENNAHTTTKAWIKPEADKKRPKKRAAGKESSATK